jgi:lysophospholipase L1-like esterase
MRRSPFVAVLAFLVTRLAMSAAEKPPLEAQRILFLGDSITHAGYYVDQFAAYLAVRYPERKFEVLNLGLPSETVSGLSEPGHAGGQFPRPDLHERLDRVLERIKPELVIACYGMNDGIYEPFDEERFAKFREGIERLRAKVAAAGARIVHLTPPEFDSEPIKNSTDPTGDAWKTIHRVRRGAGTGMRHGWCPSAATAGWFVDVHTTMRSILDARRAAEAGIHFREGRGPSVRGGSLDFLNGAGGANRRGRSSGGDGMDEQAALTRHSRRS